MREPVYNKKGQITGVIEFGTLIKRNVDPDRHQLKQPPAYAIDKDHLDRLVELAGQGSRNCVNYGVEINTITGEIWRAPIGEFLMNGIHIERGDGNQVALPLNRWHVRDTYQYSFW